MTKMPKHVREHVNKSHITTEHHMATEKEMKDHMVSGVIQAKTKQSKDVEKAALGYMDSIPEVSADFIKPNISINSVTSVPGLSQGKIPKSNIGKITVKSIPGLSPSK